MIGSGTTNPTPASYVYDEGTLVQVNAIPTGGWTLDHWLLDSVDVGSTNPYTVTMDDDHTLTAVFTEIVQYTLTIGVFGSGTTNPVPGNHVYDEGTLVPVEAVPGIGRELNHWQLDDVDVGNDNPYTVNMDANHTLVAVFTVIPGPWMYVDPQINIAHVTNQDGRPLHTVDLKKIVDLHALSGSLFTTFDTETGTLVTKEGEKFYPRIKRGLTGEIVFAYKFGYGNNKTFSKSKNFLYYTTLLYAPFALPKLYLIKYFFLYGFLVSFIVTLLFGFSLILFRNRKFIPVPPVHKTEAV